MQVKKFEAPTMQEALKVIKKELGPQAIILSTKNLKSGFGLMSRASVEVTAAVSEKDLKKKILAEKNLPSEVKEKIWNKKAEKQNEIYDNYFEKQLKTLNNERVQLSNNRKINTAQEQQPVKQKPVIQNPQSAFSNTEISRERRYIDISDEENEIEARQSLVSASRNTNKPQIDVETYEALLEKNNKNEENDYEVAPSENSSQLMKDLIAMGIEPRFARQILKKAEFDLAGKDLDNYNALLDKVAETIISDISIRDLLGNIGATAGHSEPKIYAIVGPTGVGKTTTLAKIASLAVLDKKLRVGLINLDSYKVAAADQLATYARIMNVPFRSVDNKEELQQAIYDFSSLDLVLIDTTGRSQKDQESLLMLRHLLASVKGIENLLMVSATTKDTDMQEIVSRFKLFSPSGLLFSKLDETSVFGCIYNIHKRTRIPLTYFTVGQRVPEDIEKASAERVVDLLLEL